MSKPPIILAIIAGLFFGFHVQAVNFTDGTLVKGSGPEVYVLEHGLKRWIANPNVFSQLYYRWNRIIRVSDDALAGFPPGNKLDNAGSFPDGALLKSNKNPKVYVSDQGKLRWVPDPDIFISNNFFWENILIVNDAAINNRGKGTDVKYEEFIILPVTIITEKPPAEINFTRITFRYSGANPSGPVSDLSWETYLDGYDTRWQGTSQYTRTIDLPTVNRSYKFYVRSKNKQGKIDSHPPSYSFKTAGFSPLTGKLKITGLKNKGTAKLDEYIKISNNSNDNIAITGLFIENKAGVRLKIPTGSEVYHPADGYAGNIILGKGKSATIFTGPSPVVRSFRLNKCTGYLNSYNFFQKVPEECPRSLDQSIAGFSKDCRDYITSLKTCGAPDINAFKIKYDNSCRAYLSENLNYTGCFNNYRYDPDFLKNDWYVFFERTTELWDDQHDEAKLSDQSGNKIDTHTY